MLKGSLQVPELQLPVSDNLGPSHSPDESAKDGITLAMAVVAIVLTAAYFAISVLAVSR
jgi:hypothetical protein